MVGETLNLLGCWIGVEPNKPHLPSATKVILKYSETVLLHLTRTTLGHHIACGGSHSKVCITGLDVTVILSISNSESPHKHVAVCTPVRSMMFCKNSLDS